MNVIVIFDVQTGQAAALKDGLRALGYYDSWATEGKTYFLPANAMWKPNWELGQAKVDTQRLATSLYIALLRCIVLSVSPWDGIQGTAVNAGGLPNIG